MAKIFPAQQAVNQVVEKADRFWGESPHLYIGIHCAYGEPIPNSGEDLTGFVGQVPGATRSKILASFDLAVVNPCCMTYVSTYMRFLLQVLCCFADLGKLERGIGAAPVLSCLLRGFWSQVSTGLALSCLPTSSKHAITRCKRLWTVLLWRGHRE